MCRHWAQHCTGQWRRGVGRQGDGYVTRCTAPCVGPQVELPLGATEDRICGTIDIEKALSEGVKAYEPGLLVGGRQQSWPVTRGEMAGQEQGAASLTDATAAG